MKAAVVTRYGPPDVVETQGRAGAGAERQRSARARARLDRLLRRPHHSPRPAPRPSSGRLRRPKASILGVDLAGTVVSVGRNVTRFVLGDLVVRIARRQVRGARGVRLRSRRRLHGHRAPQHDTRGSGTVFVGGVLLVVFPAQGQHPAGRTGARARRLGKPRDIRGAAGEVLRCPRDRRVRSGERRAREVARRRRRDRLHDAGLHAATARSTR